MSATNRTYQDTDSHVIPETAPVPGPAVTHTQQGTPSQTLVCVSPAHPDRCHQDKCWDFAHCSPSHPKLPANSLPVCCRQERDFCLRAGRASKESRGSSAGASAASETQTVSQCCLSLPRGLCKQLSCALRLPEAAWGTERIFTWPQRSLHGLLPWEAPRETAGTPEVPGQKHPAHLQCHTKAGQ